ncbi:alanyl-tRNA editing protein [Actinobacteria bacterium YIM 96077]|uniref:Alanyl-tRNA editing protein n=1 Tax=Phytoactinopolyspora halophila TaxID=1981511 RepID=A0A329QZ21_9ACTN|nr:alanyl-tRNA editing protein [Phytoactinopolyspora halophila]AYY13382.1 alanyl-tRNA editing protein [Actinobacteria bacterium YIM 96077]RAW17383.1 alanyl-tRNA editing protein [Phytoactinopolyspora halophila]
MAVPGNRQPAEPPRDLAETELFSVDAYARSFDSAVAEIDHEQNRVALARTAFYPGGGGQPPDVGTLRWDGGSATVTRVARDGGRIWHWLDIPEIAGDVREVYGEIDWDRRHSLMRTHTALHILCGVIWTEFGVAVTGGNMEPGTGRLDFALDGITTDLGKRVERRINEEITRAREVLVDFLPRGEADLDDALIRTRADLISREIDPLRVIDIVGLDKQADGGTHVVNTAEVGHVVVTGASSKGKNNKRIRLEIADGPGGDAQPG